MNLYYSINVKRFDLAKEIIANAKKGDYVFISFHHVEEIDEEYVTKSLELIKLANSKELKIIGDISKRTLNIFSCKSIHKLHKKLKIYAFRIDYGYDFEEICQIAKKYNVVINASTLSIEEIKKINKSAKNLIALHNFYPRPETGLDLEQFIDKSKAIKELDIPVYAFIKGDTNLRSPLCLGLPTLEHQRSYLPHVSYIELDKLNIIDGVFTADYLSVKEMKLIEKYNQDKIIPLFIKSKAPIDKQIFTVRSDSPSNLIRIKESREYATQGAHIEPFNTIKRSIGSITIDNYLYKRYSGEMMICKDSFPIDKKVNVIGNINKESIPLLKYLKNNDKFILIK